MDKLKQFFEKYHLGFLTIVMGMVSLEFIVKLLSAVQDGVIDAVEYSHLSTGASGLEMIILFIVMSVLKRR